MKKYFFTILISLIIGFFLSFFLLNQYKNYTGMAVYNEKEEYIFLNAGVYNSKEEMEKNAINLENYIYKKEDNKFYMYVGITKSKENVTKMENYYKRKNIEVSEQLFYINNNKFKASIVNLDNILVNSSDEVVVNEIINQGLNKYEEIILNGSKN